ncbi:MAG: (d)CMP kinase [Vicinamibacterales bacterium]|jgi:cytidylate kinase|nr:(d)CMP kinase [Vicinamibacterales bacterium]
MHPVIAIDGPSGVGKGTVARALAAALGYRHVDTGAMYRAVAWRAQQLGLDLDDEGAVLSVAQAAVIDVDGSRVMIDGTDVSAAIRTPDIDRATTRVARLPQVRAELVARQRALAEQGPLVMEGRDIGTVVFPAAAVKIYLDASADERARRRACDPAHSAAQTQDLAHIAEAMQRRDENDRTRQASPLTIAADATVVDTTGVPASRVADEVLAIVRARVS